MWLAVLTYRLYYVSVKVVEGEMIHGNKFLCDIGKMPIVNISMMKMIIDDKMLQSVVFHRIQTKIYQIPCTLWWYKVKV